MEDNYPATLESLKNIFGPIRFKFFMESNHFYYKTSLPSLFDNLNIENDVQKRSQLADELERLGYLSMF
jgi:hypothetical protein